MTLFKVQIERLAGWLERVYRDHPSVGLLNAMLASMAEKVTAIKSLQSTLAALTSTSNAAVGSRFRAQAKER